MYSIRLRRAEPDATTSLADLPSSVHQGVALNDSAGRGRTTRRKKDASRWGGMMWDQVYDPFANQVLSTLTAAIPVVMLLVLLASGKVKAHLAALAALAAAILVAVVVFTMPAGLAGRATLLGIATGFFRT
jgi:uncharacterized membrane protein